jgi:acyl carrier protein
MTRLDEHLRILGDELVAVKPNLRAADIGPDSSLTEDLGFDSLDLVTLSGRIRTAYPDFDLRVWLADAMTDEGDSVGSMARLLAACARTPEEVR